MKRRVTQIALALGLAGGVSTLFGVALAEGHGRHRKEKMAVYDRNRDGTLDQGERAAMKKELEATRAAKHKEALARYDEDKDGELSDAERGEMVHDRMVQRFESIDTNRDGEISFAEFESHAKTKRRWRP
jgi:Ca2+-binding EF-hand superfamily protein